MKELKKYVQPASVSLDLRADGWLMDDIIIHDSMGGEQLSNGRSDNMDDEGNEESLDWGSLW